MPSRRSKTPGTNSPQSSALNHTTKNDQNIHKKPQPHPTSTTPQATDSLASISAPPSPPPNWPPSLPYLTHPILSPYLPPSHLKWLRTRPQPPNDDLPVITLPSSLSETLSRVEIRVIDDPDHPACGQRGLFASRDLAPGELVVVYLGYVHGSTAVERGEWERMRAVEELRDGKVDGDVSHDVGGSIGGDTAIGTGSETRTSGLGTADLECGFSSTSASTSPSPPTSTSHPPESKPNTPTNPNQIDIGTWDTSSYDLNMYRAEDIEIAVDASTMGNEARFVNDYRGVPVQMMERGVVAHGGVDWRRKDKRRVKGWEGGKGDDGAEGRGGEEGDGIGVRGQWAAGDGSGSGNFSTNNGHAISMPNAEFRDVWFDIPIPIPSDIDLTPDISKSNNYSHNNINNYNYNDRDITTLNTTLNNIHLNNTSNISSPTQTSNPQHGDNKTTTTATNTTDTQHESNPNPKSKPRRKKKTGLRGVAVFVMPAGKSGKRKGGIKKGKEVLVSYGKGFWAHHGVEGG